METGREDSPEPRVIAADTLQEGDEEARTREKGKQREMKLAARQAHVRGQLAPGAGDGGRREQLTDAWGKNQD
jgi:hypothetical protein